MDQPINESQRCRNRRIRQSTNAGSIETDKTTQSLEPNSVDAGTYTNQRILSALKPTKSVDSDYFTNRRIPSAPKLTDGPTHHQNPTASKPTDPLTDTMNGVRTDGSSNQRIPLASKLTDDVKTDGSSNQRIPIYIAQSEGRAKTDGSTNQ